MVSGIYTTKAVIDALNQSGSCSEKKHFNKGKQLPLISLFQLFITHNQQRKFLHRYESKAQIDCQMDLLNKPFEKVYYHLLGDIA